MLFYCRTLEDFVNGEKFMKIKDANYSDLSEQIEEVNAPLTKSQMENTIRGIGKQIATVDFPDDSSDIYYIVHHTIRDVESVIRLVFMHSTN